MSPPGAAGAAAPVAGAAPAAGGDACKGVNY